MATLQDQVSRASTSTFLSALYIYGGIALVGSVIFSLFLRRLFPHQYSPRASVEVNHRRLGVPSPPRLTAGFFRWVGEVLRTPEEEVIRQNGLDAFLFIRFLRVQIEFFLPLWAAGWIILLPVDSVRIPDPLPGLNRFTFSNLTAAPENMHIRWCAHLILAWLYTRVYLFSACFELD